MSPVVTDTYQAVSPVPPGVTDTYRSPSPVPPGVNDTYLSPSPVPPGVTDTYRPASPVPPGVSYAIFNETSELLLPSNNIASLLQKPCDLTDRMQKINLGSKKVQTSLDSLDHRKQNSQKSSQVTEHLQDIAEVGGATSAESCTEVAAAAAVSQVRLDRYGLPYPDRVPMPTSGDQVYITWVNSPHDFMVGTKVKIMRIFSSLIN